MTIRPFAPGDDLALNEVFHDASTPAGHVVRNLFRADSESPVSRCVVATLADSEAGEGSGSRAGSGSGPSDGASDILVGAAAIAESPAHPERAWVHVEVAESERRRGVGRDLLAAVRERAAGTVVADLPLRARVEPGAAGEAAAQAVGFSPLFTTRVVEVAPGALGSLGADRLEDFEVTATGSVALTRAFGEWYTGVNRADPAAEMTIGQVNTRFLSEAAGAHGAALLRAAGSGKAESGKDREVTTFAVSYARPETDTAADAGAPVSESPTAELPPTELTLGSMYDAQADTVGDGSMDASDDPAFQAALGDAAVLLARLSVDTPVALEVTSEMPVLSALVDGLLEAGQARVLQTYVTLGSE
ncbi:GNAT family N-acetyltransferase [Brevibacterium sp. R8603A2]|uniref:GNAT family N-acetyltransferase n=1 Tax=Brevibacterium sp. R8603A2 TaxID=2929779 RepID=UPI001FF8E6A7|nr:GNAT family N-acetyltransferase [Brevibacterium sp. R8603A2]MCK1801504.1 GNAT family N-acetyltransferase [Brevibacterium sp. R8603A2]